MIVVELWGGPRDGQQVEFSDLMLTLLDPGENDLPGSIQACGKLPGEPYGFYAKTLKLSRSTGHLLYEWRAAEE